MVANINIQTHITKMTTKLCISKRNNYKIDELIIKYFLLKQN